jgi:hypothetical protein
MSELPWWAASQNKWLNEKLGRVFRHEGRKTATDYLSFPDLVRVRIMADGNMGGNFFRFFGFFENDPERYFDIFSKWDIEIPWDTLKTGLVLKVGDRSWQVTELDGVCKGFLFEFELIQT